MKMQHTDIFMECTIREFVDWLIEEYKANPNWNGKKNLVAGKYEHIDFAFAEITWDTPMDTFEYYNSMGESYEYYRITTIDSWENPSPFQILYINNFSDIDPKVDLIPMDAEPDEYKQPIWGLMPDVNKDKKIVVWIHTSTN